MSRILIIIGIMLLVLTLLNKYEEFTKKEELLQNKYQYNNIQLNETYQNNFIIRLHNKDDQFFCSGFVIDDNYAITASHCVNEGFGGINILSTQDIIIYNSKSQKTKIIAKAAAMGNRMDYAIIKGDFSKFDRRPIVTDKVEINLNHGYKSCGFPLGNKKIFCTKVEILSDRLFALFGKGHLYPGMSGGPLIDTDTGEIIGVNSYVTADGSAYYPLIGILDSFGIGNE